MRVNKFLIAFVVLLLCPITAWFLHVTGNRNEGAEPMAVAVPAPMGCSEGWSCVAILDHQGGCASHSCCPSEPLACLYRNEFRNPGTIPRFKSAGKNGGICVKSDPLNTKVSCYVYDCDGTFCPGDCSPTQQPTGEQYELDWTFGAGCNNVGS
ncbi:MAG: hypothetical protein AABZ12_07395 [Planctomycetota bacterium]